MTTLVKRVGNKMKKFIISTICAFICSNPLNAYQNSIRIITLPNGLKISQYEITQGQWKSIMGKNPSHFSNCGDACPVEMVSYNDVLTFIEKLNHQTGMVFRLPTEKEWISACIANQYHSLYCGSQPLDEYAWFKENSHSRTHRVGQKKPNAWGLYDLSGNVNEWSSTCADNLCERHVYLGGSWFVFQKEIEEFHREHFTNDFISHNLGFRLVLTSP